MAALDGLCSRTTYLGLAGLLGLLGACRAQRLDARIELGPGAAYAEWLSSGVAAVFTPTLEVHPRPGAEGAPAPGVGAGAARLEARVFLRGLLPEGGQAALLLEVSGAAARRRAGGPRPRWKVRSWAS